MIKKPKRLAHIDWKLMEAASGYDVTGKPSSRRSREAAFGSLMLQEATLYPSSVNKTNQLTASPKVKFAGIIV